MSDMQTERRGNPRYQLHVPFRCWELKDGKPVEPCIELTCRNLSIAGLAFESDINYKIGTELMSELHVPGRARPVTACLEVVWVKSRIHDQKFSIGTQFKDIAKEDEHFVAASLIEMNLNGLLIRAVEEGASDIHLTVGHSPVIRVDGSIHYLDTSPIQEGQIKAMIYPLLSSGQIHEFESKKELDFAFSPNPNCRFRVNLHFQKGFVEATLRTVESSIKAFKELGLPVNELETLCQKRSGIILIAGTTGSGKTTTMSAMVDYINTHMEKVIITIEDPIERIHRTKRSIIKQRELGNDTRSFAEALNHALRQDPDVVVVGALRDQDSAIAALRAAETGHLIISTIDAADAPQALENMVSLFSSDLVQSISSRLSLCLLGVLYQALVPNKRSSLSVGTELLLNNEGISSMLRSQNYPKMRASLKQGAGDGMHTLEISLRKLYQDLVIDKVVMESYGKAA